MQPVQKLKLEFCKERVLVAGWTKEYGAKLTDNIGSVILEVKALSSNEGIVTLGYEFENFAQSIENR
jgi:hypothetical protein